MSQTDPDATTNPGTTSDSQLDDTVDFGQDNRDMPNDEELPGAMINSDDVDLNPNDDQATPDLDPDR